MEAIGDLVGQDIFAVLEVGHHGLTVHLVGLEKKDIDNRKDGERDYDCLEEVEEE